jgi:hypothetical protein
VDQAALPQRGRKDLLDRRDQAAGAIGDDQQRTRQAAVAQVGQEIGPGVGRLPGAGGQAHDDGLAGGGDPPGGQDRLGRRARMHPEEGGIQKQVIQHDIIAAAGRPGVVLGLDRLAYLRDSRFRDRGLIPERIGQGGPDHHAPTAPARTRRSPTIPARGSW